MSIATENRQTKPTSPLRPMPGSVAIIRLFGVPIRLHFTFALLLLYLLFLILGQQSGPYTALDMLGLFASVLLHELGHVLVARHYAIGTLEVVLFPIGGIGRPERVPTPREEFWIALAGPIVNLLLAAALVGALPMTQGPFDFDRLIQLNGAKLIQRLAIGNLALCIFNLAPAFPMDGGRVLRSLLARRYTEEETTRVAARSGQFLSILLGLWGLIWSSFILVFIAMFVFLGAMHESAAVRGRILSSGFPVRAAMMTDFRTLQHGDTLRDAGNLLLATSQTDFPVMHGEQVIGLLTRRLLARAMMRDGPNGYVSGIMDRDFLRLSPDTPLNEIVPDFSAAGDCALVMDEENRLLGMITSENIAKFLLLRQARVL